MKKTYVKKFIVFTIIQHGFWLLSEVTIKQAKKDVRWALKIVKIEEIFMFYHLKPWKSWQVGHYSYEC
jgi:hypothetical protein